MLDYSYTIDLELKVGSSSGSPEDSISSLLESSNCSVSFSSLLISSSEYLGSNVFRIYCDGEESDIDLCDDIETFLDFTESAHMTVENGSEIKMVSTHPINPVCFSWVYEAGEWEFYESVDNSYGISGFEDPDDYLDFN